MFKKNRKIVSYLPSIDDSYEYILNVIDSCKTLDHWINCVKLINNFKTMFKHDKLICYFYHKHLIKIHNNMLIKLNEFKYK